jgi:hypothetical protein
LQQNDYNSQYNDFTRQTGAMQQGYQNPQQQILQMLYGGGYKGQYQPTYGSSTLDQIAGLLGGQGGLGNIDWASLANGIFGGGGTGSGTQAQTGADGQVIGYDAQAPIGGPANYYDKNWYLNALTSAENSAQNRTNAAQKGPNTTVPAILTLLMSLLGKGKGGGASKGGGAGAGGGPGSPGGGRGLIDSIRNRNNPYPAGSPQSALWREYFKDSGAPVTPGQSAPLYSGNGSDLMPGAIGYTPDNPLSGGGTQSFADFYNSQPYTFDNAGNGPNIGTFDPNTDFSGMGGSGGGGGDGGGFAYPEGF